MFISKWNHVDYGWSNVAKFNEIILWVQWNNYFDSTNYLHIQRNNYFDSTIYLYIQRIIYIFSERIIFIQPIKYIYLTSELKYFSSTK